VDLGAFAGHSFVATAAITRGAMTMMTAVEGGDIQMTDAFFQLVFDVALLLAEQRLSQNYI